MIINLIYDSSANNAPASFKAAMQQAAAILDAAITNPITVTIKVGYGVWPGPGAVPLPAGQQKVAPMTASPFHTRKSWAISLQMRRLVDQI
jgi:hypothetical protein